MKNHNLKTMSPEEINTLGKKYLKEFIKLENKKEESHLTNIEEIQYHSLHDNLRKIQEVRTVGLTGEESDITTEYSEDMVDS